MEDSIVDSTPCPSCEAGFDTVRGMKIHHSQVHGRAVHELPAAALNFFKDHSDHALVTVLDEETGQVTAYYGTIHEADYSKRLEAGGRTFTIAYYGGKSPSAFYIHRGHPESDPDDHPDPLGYVTRIETVETATVTAGETGLETTYSGRTNVETLLDDAST